MTACCQITYRIPWLPCEQLPYPPEHPRISWIRQRDKLEMPLLTLSYKYFFSWYSFSTLPSFISLAAALSKSSRTSAKSPSTVSQVFDRFLLREEMAVNFVVPKVNLFPSFLSLPHLFTFCKSTYLAFFFLLSVSLLFQSSNLRNRAIKLFFLPSNLTINASVHWVIWILLIWLMRRQIEFPLEPRTFL